MRITPKDVFGDTLPDLLNRLVPKAKDIREALKREAKEIASKNKGKPFYYSTIAADKSGLSYRDYWNKKALDCMMREQRKLDSKYEASRWEEAFEYAKDVQIEDVTRELFPDGNHKRGCPSPFAGNKSNSFFIYPKTNSFYCFSSGKGGTPIDYVMEREGLEFKEAINYLYD